MVGCGWGLDKSTTRPADVLASNWDGSASAACDITVTSLHPSLVVEVSMSSGGAARAAEKRKHSEKDAKCKKSLAGGAFP